MIVTVASFKGGVGKTTTAVHLAAYLNTLAPTLLLDGDPEKIATDWHRAGKGFPFRVAPVQAAMKLSREYAHTVLDTGQRPSVEDLQASVEFSDLLVIPCPPMGLDSNGLGKTVRALQKIPGANFRVLLTSVPAFKASKATALREALTSMGVSTFAAEIPRLDAFDKAAVAGAIVSAVKDPNGARAWAAYEAAGKELFT